MASWIDAALYPDREAPDVLESIGERVDFLARLCVPGTMGFFQMNRRSLRFAVPAGGPPWMPAGS